MVDDNLNVLTEPFPVAYVNFQLVIAENFSFPHHATPIEVVAGCVLYQH